MDSWLRLIATAYSQSGSQRYNNDMLEIILDFGALHFTCTDTLLIFDSPTNFSMTLCILLRTHTHSYSRVAS